MRARRLSSVARATGGRLAGDDATVTGAAVDTRDVRKGDLFAALKGERLDGHAFVNRAFELGATGALVSRTQGFAGPVVVVSDTRRALLDLADDERSAGGQTVIGVTGSTGKTSVKDLAVAVLAARFSVAGSPHSYNTEVGVPLTLLGAGEDVEVVVCEMGSRGRGHIRQLADVARPRIGVVTNVGVAHMEFFGSAEAIADAKAELVEALPRDGTAVLNADDPVVRDFGSRTSARALLFGRSADAEVRGEDLALDELGRASFTLRAPVGAERVELGVPGEHMASNALAAAAAGIAMGLTPGECAAALKEARLSAWRMQVLETSDGIRVVNDAYNANPTSTAAALKAARWMARGGRCIAVLGEMAELGPISVEEHERVGEIVARLGVEFLVTVGEAARRILTGAVREGVEAERAVACATREEALARVRDIARPGDVVLVKGSRVAGLEWVAESLAEGE